MITVVIVEDYARLRSLYEKLLAGDPLIRCVAKAERGDEALRMVPELRPDVLLVDISLPDVNGLEVARGIKALCPSAHVVILGEGDGEEYRSAARASGASAYLRKEHTIEQLVPLIHRLTAESECQSSQEIV
jgi:DNA-binding NarL/FixJ family response regulator